MITSAQDVQESLSHTLETVRLWTSQLVLEGDVTRAEMGLGLVRLIEEKVVPQAKKMGLASFDKQPVSQQTATNFQLRHQSEIASFASSDPDNEKAPFFFILKDRLVKIGVASSKKNGYYKKAIPLARAEQIMHGLEQLSRDQQSSLSAKQLIAFFNSTACCAGDKCPDYHIHLVLGALEKAGVLLKLKRDSRGSYKLVGSPHDTNAWMQAIEKLKRREDLYKIAE